MCLEALTYPPRGTQRVTFNVISNPSTILTPLDSKNQLHRDYSCRYITTFVTYVKNPWSHASSFPLIFMLHRTGPFYNYRGVKSHLTTGEIEGCCVQSYI
jgi:hypothetical protein